MDNKASSLYGIYIHIPFCNSRCGYCNFVSCTDLQSVDLYLKSLEREMESCAKKGVSADSIYIGGGTPSVLNPKQLERVLKAVYNNYDIKSGSEISIEVNPEGCTDSFVKAAQDMGVSRFSLGLQAADFRLLNRVGRKARFEDFVNALDILTARNADNVSVDLMLGLPGQVMSDITDTLYSIMSNIITHISLYSLKVEPNTRLYESGYVPDEDLCADMYGQAYRIMEDNGYMRYEVSNFAKRGFECCHNLKYWNLNPYLGFGAAAHCYYDDKRGFNTSNISKYILGDYGKEFQALTSTDVIQEYVMLGLRKSEGINLNELKSRTGYDLLKSKKAQIDALILQGFLIFKDDFLSLSADAFYVMNSVIVKLID